MTTTIAVIGGTGDLGLGLAARLSRTNRVIIGSRDATRASEAAERASGLSGSDVSGKTNELAASEADVLILAVPDLPSDELLSSLRASASGKLVISPIVPMEFRGGLFFPKVAATSAAERVASALDARVAAAFHHVPAARLLEVNNPLDYDVMVTADDRGVYEETSKLVSSIERLRPLYAGPLRNSSALEMLTPTLLNAGKLNKIRTPSIRVV